MRTLVHLNGETLEKAALAYATIGWPVLPLNPRQKTPAGHLVKTGLLEATTDLGIIRTWWERYPGCNIGLRTGIEFDVIDLDGQAALSSFRALVPDGYRHPGPTAATGKGYHLLIAVTGARNAAAKLPGIDFRGQNGYIVAAPSVHPDGHKYQWINDNLEVHEAGDWVQQIITPKRTGPPSGINPDDMEDIVAVYMKTFGDLAPVNAMGSRFITNCPWHDDSTPSLVLYPENNSFYCFGCNEWGDTLDVQRSILEGGAAPSKWQGARS